MAGSWLLRSETNFKLNTNANAWPGHCNHVPLNWMFLLRYLTINISFSARFSSDHCTSMTVVDLKGKTGQDRLYVIAPLVAVLRMQCLLLGTLYVGPVPNGTLLTSLHFCGVSPLWLSGRSLTSIVDFSHAHTPAIVIPQDHKSIWNVPFGTIHIHSALHLKQCSQLFSVFIYFC